MLDFIESLESRIATRFEALEARISQTPPRQDPAVAHNRSSDHSRDNAVNTAAQNTPAPTPRPAQSFAAANLASAGPARAPEGFSTTSSRMTQPPTAAVSSMIAAPEEVLVGEVGLVPIYSQDPEYSRLLDYRRYRLAPAKMSYDANVQPEKVKGRFPLTLQCVQGGPFDGNGEEPSKPLAGSVLTFLKILSMEANASNLTEGDVRAAFTSLVGPKVGAALLQEGLTVGTKVTSYCGTVNWLLQEYGKETDLRLAASRMGTFRQAPDETPKHFQQRLITSMGNLRSEQELKGQFLFGSSAAAQASMKALKVDFRSPWDDLLAAAESGDIRQRRTPRPQPATTPRRTVGVISPTPSLSPAESSGGSVSAHTQEPTSHYHSAGTREAELVDADDEDIQVFVAQQFLLTESRPPRGDLTCYLCFRPGHIVVDCNLLPEKEMKELLERRSAFFSRRTRSAWSRTPRFIPRSLPLEDQRGARAGAPEGRNQGF